MAADVVDAQGKPVRGEVGELVLRAPWVGMTNGFWKDPDRYLEAYWSRWPDIWVHGDWALIDDEGFWYIQGRSDDTIKIAGKRLGPAEVESAAITHPAVQECAAIGVPHELKGGIEGIWGNETAGFGLTWWSQVRDGDRYFAHSGSLSGYTAFLLGNRDRKLGFAILTNGNRAHPHLFKLADRAMDLMKKHSSTEKVVQAAH